MLSGRPILIVEAQYIVALDLQATLEVLEADQVTIVQDASLLAATDLGKYALAIMELEREDAMQIALAGQLTRMRIPLIGMTTDHELTKSVNWLAAIPILSKPVQSDLLIETVSRLLSRPGGQNE